MTIYHFYAGGNTAKGYTSLLQSSLQDVERLYLLQGGVGLGKLCDIRSIGNQLAAAGYEVWFLHCPSDNAALDGLVFPGLKIGIVDGTAPHVVVPEKLKAELHIVNIEEACESEQLDAARHAIDSLYNEISQSYELAYSGFAEALRVHDDWEQVYIANMNFQTADELTREYIQILYGDRKHEKQGRTYHRFLGAATPKGAVDFVPQLTAGLKRYLVKGRPGSGKSTMLKKLASEAADRGIDVEIYHCGFDPNSLDMIIVRELGFAIFDSTAPHEYFPDRPSDEILDMYERCIQSGTDESYAESINPIKARYSAKMKQSIQLLAQTRSLHDEQERLYAQTVNPSAMERVSEAFRQEITRFAAIQIS